jgi:hypothetical protein
MLQTKMYVIYVMCYLFYVCAFLPQPKDNQVTMADTIPIKKMMLIHRLYLLSLDIYTVQTYACRNGKKTLGRHKNVTVSYC